MALASDGKGNFLSLGDDGQWTPATRAKNPETGDELVLDGREWKPLPVAPEPASPARGTGHEAALGFGRGVRNVVEGVTGVAGMAMDAVSYPSRVARRAFGQAAPSFSEGTAERLDAVGLPREETDAQRLVGAGVRGVASALPTMGAGMGLQVLGRAPALAEALAGGATSQLVGSAAGEVAAEGTRQAGGGELAQSAAGLVGGLGGAVGVAGTQAAGRGLRAAAMPFGEEGRQRILADLLNRSTARPDTLAARVAGGAEPRVPGSVPTSAEAAVDPGLAQLQRAVQGMDPQSADAFALRDASRDAARRAEVGAIEPSAAGAPELAAAVRGGVAREEARGELGARRAGALLQGRLGQLPEAMTPEAAGAGVRAPLLEARDAAKAATGRAFEAIDPEGTSRIPIEPIRSAAAEAEGKYFGRFSGGMPAELQGVVDDLAKAGEVASWRDMQDLRRRLGVLGMHADPRVQSVAGQLRQAIDDTAERAAQPMERPSRPVTAEDIDRGYAAEGAGQHPDIADRLTLSRDDLGATAGQQPPPEGLSLVQFLRREGGLRNDGGEIAAMMGGTGRMMPGLWNNSGLSLERAAQRAFEKGYIKGNRYGDGGPVGATPRDLADAIDAELRGSSKAYAGGDVRNLRGGGRGPTLADDLDQEIQARGGSYDPSNPDATLRSLRGVEESPTGAGAEMPDRFQAIDNAFTPEQAEAWRVAQAKRREQGRLFDRGPVRDVLAQRYGDLTVPDSAVMGRIFKPGGGGPEAVRQVLAAAGDRPGTVAALEGHAASSLRQAAARPDGTLDPAKWQAWMAKHADVLREMPELQGRMRSAGEAAATVDRVAFAQRARVKELERGVAKPFLDKDPDKAVRAALGSDNASANIAELRRLVGDDPGALQALRRAYLDEWLRRTETTTLNLRKEFVLSPAMAQRFMRNHDGAARQIFDQAALKRIETLAEDLSLGGFPASAGRAAGSPTYQNLSTANFVARLSNGTIDPNNAIAQSLGSGFGILQKFVYAAPERIMRDMLREAMLDPVYMGQVLAKASPDSIRNAVGYLEHSMLDRLQQAAARGALRQGIRSLNEAADERPTRQQMLARALASPERASMTAAQRAALAQQLGR